MARRTKKPKKPKIRHVSPLTGEQWALVPGTDDYYISNLGRFKRVTDKGDSLRKASIDAEGYCRVNIGHKKLRLHRWVAEAFVPNPNNLPVVDHLDTNKQNCRWDNLEWVTKAENTQRAAKMGLTNNFESTPVLAIDTTDRMCYLFKTMADCAKFLKIPSKSTSKVASGKQKTTHGFEIIKIVGFMDRRFINDKE